MSTTTSVGIKLYRPSLSAIKYCMNYFTAELCIAIFIVAIFVNSAIIIIAAASLCEAAKDADLFEESIFKLQARCLPLLYCSLESVQELWQPWHATGRRAAH